MSAIVLRGDAAHLPLPDASVDLICTSPPYYALRAYSDGGEIYGGQIGSEATPQQYLEALWCCTAEWVRILKPGGSIFVVLGDKYSGAQQQTHGRQSGESSGEFWRRTDPARTGIPNKSLMLLPERYRIGCVDRMGLIAREVIEWSKVNGMPESAADRCRRSHEDIIHLVKQARYFDAVDEIREPHQPQSLARTKRNRFAPDLTQVGVGSPNTLNPADACHPLGKLPGSVWEIATAPLIVPDRIAHSRCCGGRKRKDCEDGLTHHAAYPPDLCRRIILGWSPPGICTACGEGRRPVAAEVGWARGKSDPVRDTPSRFRSPLGAQNGNKEGKLRALTGYACACPRPDAPTRPAVVADPFGGTGTTSLVADVLGRTGITVDRSADYCRLAQWRTTDPSERARAMQVPKPPPVPENQRSLFDDLEAS